MVLNTGSRIEHAPKGAPFFKLVLSALISFALAGCGGGEKVARLDIIYNAAAKTDRPDRNPVIVIPGILGSRLKDEDTGITVWGAFVRGAADPQKPEGARLISLPVTRGLPLIDLRDNVKPDGVMEEIRVEILGIPLQLKAYAAIMSTLGAGGYRDQSLGLAGAIDYGSDHYTCYQYAFDWRRDNAENAAILYRYIQERHAEVQAEYKERFGIENAEVKFDIVAHSMGGLVTRYMLRYGDQPLTADGPSPVLNWAGAKYVSRVILVGTPNAGATDALLDLVKGRDIGMPFLPFYQPALMGTFPSVYELLPRARHGHVVYDGDVNKPVADLYDPALWQRYGWGLASPDQEDLIAEMLPNVPDPKERRAIAIDVQARILAQARAFAAALDLPQKTPEGLDIILVAGDAIETVKTLSVDSKTGEVSILEMGAGDGTVLRSSALMDERVGGEWQPYVRSPIDYSHVMFLPDDHLGLTRSNIFRDNVLYWLLEDPRGAVSVPNK
ncbi:MAG: hypothetical protein JKY60_02370 [Kordiimonadaceae bacterium]|nr:hypothetical protein [Kordiimonadaceae bacterium]